MSRPAYDVEKMAENSRGIYWAVGPSIHVLEMPGYTDERRFLCLTDLRRDCKHIEAVKRHLGETIQENAA